MRHIVIKFLLLLCFALPAKAQTDSLVITLKNGETIVLALSQFQKITFDSVKNDVHWNNPQTHNLLVMPSFPNPLQKSTTINFTLAAPGAVSVTIYDSKGNVIRRLKSDCQAGQNRIIWNTLDNSGAEVPSGEYFYEVRFGGEVQTRKMVIIR
jgi:flagellar hook assembly protein FlgD